MNNFSNFHLLYIDPGTGSALFTIIIGIAATVVFAFQAFFIKLKTFFFGGKAKLGVKNKYVIYAENKRYWTLFKPIVEEFETRNIELLYLTSSEDDPVFQEKYKYIKPEYLGEGNKAFARLNFLSADFVLSTTPGLDVYQWKRSKNVKHYCHILHMPILSTYELYGIDYYDSILISSEYDKDFIRKLENVRNLPEKQIATVGCPYLDEYLKKITLLPKEEKSKFTVLISPSWGKSALLTRFGEKLIDPLVIKDWNIIVRPHPQSLTTEKELIDMLTEKYKANCNLIWDFERENIYSLSKADVMVSDFSGIILDFLFLFQKPVFYASEKMDIRPYDEIEIYDNQNEMYLFKILRKTGISINADSINNLPQFISEAVSDVNLEKEILQTKKEVWNYQGEAGKNTADFMIKTAGRENA